MENGNKKDYTVTSFVFSENEKRLSDMRAFYYLNQRLEKYRKNKNIAPVSVALCPTSLCIRKCEFCSNHERNKINSAKNIQLKPRILEKIVMDLDRMGVKGVSIAGGGEPLLYSQNCFEAFITNAKGCKFGIHTNGVYLEKIMSNSIVGSGNIDYINISIVAHKADLYKKVCGADEKQFYKIVENIKMAICLASKNDNFPTFGVKILLSRANYKYAAEMYNFYLKDLRVKNILLRSVSNFEPGQDVELYETQKKELENLLRNSLCLSSEQINTIVYGKNYETDKLPVPSKCWVNELKYCAGVDPDGEIYLCSPWSRKGYSIGNINYKCFDKIWNSENHQNVIKKLSNNVTYGRCNPLACRHYYTNLAIEQYVNETGKLPDLSFEEDYCRFI